MRYLLFLIFGLIISSVGFAQTGTDLPPVFLDNIYLKHYVVLHSDYGTNKTNYSSVYTNVGFGRINGNPNAPNHNWKIRDSNGTVDPTDDVTVPYVWFKIENTGNGSMDDYWFTTPAAWNAYLIDKNVATLRANSWQFAMFLILSSYTPPPAPSEGIIWEERTEYLTVGYTTTSNIIVVKKHSSGAWEWTIRGQNAAANDTWTLAPDRSTAMTNATQAHTGQ